MQLLELNMPYPSIPPVSIQQRRVVTYVPRRNRHFVRHPWNSLGFLICRKAL